MAVGLAISQLLWFRMSVTMSRDHGELMDSIYRYERWLYDPLRRFFLLGRDRLLERLARLVPREPPGRVLEVGCGTARNLIALHRRRPDLELYGLDASAKMLQAARAKLRRRRLEAAIRLRQGLAEELDLSDYGPEEPLDVVFFSYSLSMIHDGRGALDAALDALAPTGTLHAVDFWDQAELPRWCGVLVRAILACYHVRFRRSTLDHLRRLEAAGAGVLQLEPIWRRHAFLATFHKAADPPVSYP